MLKLLLKAEILSCLRTNLFLNFWLVFFLFSRLRDKESSDDFTVDASSVNIGASAVSVNLIAEDETYLLTIYAIQDDTFRVTLEDTEHERYKVTDSLKDEPRLAR